MDDASFPDMPRSGIESTLRCLISYGWEGSKSSGSHDFGVKCDKDPKIKDMVNKLKDRGCVIRSVRVY